MQRTRCIFRSNVLLPETKDSTAKLYLNIAYVIYNSPILICYIRIRFVLEGLNLSSCLYF